MINALGKGSQNQSITAEAGQRARGPSTQDDRDFLWSVPRTLVASWQTGLASPSLSERSLAFEGKGV